MRANIDRKKEIASGILEVVFEILDQENLDFKPGQYFFINLINPPYNDNRGTRRHFTFINSPNEKGIVRMATRLGVSAFKRSLLELPVGSEVEIGPIGGKFILPADQHSPFVFIAGGIGITPFLSMLAYIREESLDVAIKLIYSNRDSLSAAYLDLLYSFLKNNPLMELILTMTQDPSWGGENRRVDGAFIKSYLSGDVNSYSYFLSGPPGFVEASVSDLNSLGVCSLNIKTENFAGY